MSHININDFFGLREIDVFGLIYDYKKVISAGISESYLKNLKNTFIKYGLRYEPLDESFDYQKQNKTYLISKKTKYLKGTKSAYKSGRFDLVGWYLGYPKCCIKYYSEKFLFSNASSDKFIRNIYHNSNNFFWQLNNILNFDGRIKDRNLPGGFSSFIKKIGFISLISHSPCSYDCGESLKIAYLNHDYLFSYDKLSLNDYIILKKPVLYIDDFHFIIFEGHSGHNFIQYSKVLLSLGAEQLREYLLKADKIRIDNNSAIVLKEKSILGKVSYKKKILLLPFDKSI